MARGSWRLHHEGKKESSHGPQLLAARAGASPVSPARNADSLDDVDGDLAEEDEKEDEEAEGAVRPAGETAAGVKTGDLS